MLCQKCGERQATFHYKQNINGKKTEIYLCEHCRKEMANDDFFDAGLNWNDFFGVLDSPLSIFGGGSGLLSQGANAAQSRRQPVVCEHCGMRFEDFKNGGNLGCGYCYETFRNRLEGVIKRLHGSTKHKGRLPEKINNTDESDDVSNDVSVSSEAADEKMVPENDIPTLKAKIKDAVMNEDYEEAARLRDIIRIIEAGENDE